MAIKCDGVCRNDLAITAGSAVAVSPGAPFLPKHEGWSIVIQPTPTDRQIFTIAQVVSPSEILMSGEASATQEASIFYFGNDQSAKVDRWMNRAVQGKASPRLRLKHGILMLLRHPQDPAGANSVLVVPPRYQPSSPATLCIEGAVEPPGGYWGSVQTGNGQPQHQTGTIIYCPMSRSGEAPAGIFGTNAVNKTGTGPIPPNFDIGFSTTALTLRNLTIRGKANPSLDVLQFDKGGNVIGDHLMCDTDYWNSRTPDPLSGNAIALRLPRDGNNGKQALRDVYIQGYRAAIRPGEHFDFDGIFIQSCRAGLYADVQLGPHGKRIGKIVIQETTIPVECNGFGFSSLSIDVLNIEQSTTAIQNPELAWTESAFDWDDPDNLSTAVIGVVKLRQAGAATQFNVNGGNGVLWTDLTTGITRMGGFWPHGIRQHNCGHRYYHNQLSVPTWIVEVFSVLGGASGGDYVFQRGTPHNDIAGLWRHDTGELVAMHGIRHGALDGPLDLSGSGSPEGVVPAPVGSTYRRTDGGAGTSFYVKESGAGNTGWVAK